MNKEKDVYILYLLKYDWRLNSNLPNPIVFSKKYTYIKSLRKYINKIYSNMGKELLGYNRLRVKTLSGNIEMDERAASF